MDEDKVAVSDKEFRGSPWFVFVLDAEGVFDAPIQKIWRLHDSPEHIHPSVSDAKFEKADDGSVTYVSGTLLMPNGGRVRNRIRLAAFPPLGFSMEWIKGLFAGSKEFSYYVPQGERTGVVSVGEWTSPLIPREQVKQTVLKFLDTVYTEDQANLARMK